MYNIEKTDLAVKSETISTESFAKALDLEIIFGGRGTITLNSVSTSRPGLKLTGYFKHFDHNRVQLIGNAEHDYLLSMPKQSRDKNFPRQAEIKREFITTRLIMQEMMKGIFQVEMEGH